MTTSRKPSRSHPRHTAGTRHETHENPQLLSGTRNPPIADVLTAFYYKRINDLQSSSAAPAVLAANGYASGALVYDNPSYPGFIIATNIGPGYAPSNPTYLQPAPGPTPGSTDYFLNTNYNTQAALDAAFPEGQYTIALNTVHDGMHNFILTLSSNFNGYVTFNYPNAPHIDDYAALQSANPSAPITVTWDAMQIPQSPAAPSYVPPEQAGNQNDFEQLQIKDSTGKVVYASPVLGALTHLDGYSTGTTIPAGTLAPGQTYSADLLFVKIAAQDTSSYPNVLGCAGFAHDTAFTLTTLHAPPSIAILPPTASVPANTSVSVTVQVSPSDGSNVTPSGTVTLFDGITTLGTANLANGSAAFTESSLAAGSHALSASYSGDSNFVPVTPTATVHYTVAPAPFTFPTSNQIIVTAPDAGYIPLVKVFDATTGQMAFDFLAYDSAFSGAVHVAAGPLTGHSTSDIITATGRGGQPLINVFSGATGALVSSFYAYNPNFTGGVEIAIANVLGLPAPQIITSTDAGGQPLINIFNSTGTLLANFYAYSPDYLGGVHLTATSGDPGHIITTNNAGARPIANIFDPAGTLLGNFYAQFADVTGAPNIAAGNPYLFVGADAGNTPQVNFFVTATGNDVGFFNAYDPAFLGGVRVAALPLFSPLETDVVTAPGPGGTPQINIFELVPHTLVRSFLAYDASVTTGLFVAAADFAV